MTKMSRKDMILFAKDKRVFFSGTMGNFLDNVISVLSEDSLMSEVQNPDAKRIGMRIKTVMLERGMNQRMLARKTGVSEQCISRYVKGQRTPNAECMEKLSIALDASPGYFYGLEPLKTSNRKQRESGNRR